MLKRHSSAILPAVVAVRRHVATETGDRRVDLQEDDRSTLTAYGQRLIDEMRTMGVEVRHALDVDEQQYMKRMNVRGITRFDPPEVVLRNDANDAVVYEEHLHILAGQARGWTNVGFPDSVVEEAWVGQQVLDHANELGMTNIERVEQKMTVQGYLPALHNMGVDLE